MNFTTENITEWSKHIINLIKGNTPIQGSGMLISKKPNGYLFEIDQKSGGGAILEAKLKTVVDENNYTADIYSNRDEAPLFEDVEFKVLDIVDELSVGDWIPASQKPHGTPVPVTYWTAAQQLGDV